MWRLWNFSSWSKFFSQISIKFDVLFFSTYLQIKHMDSTGFKNCKKREKTVSRAYGGSRCGNCVRQRWVKSCLSVSLFLVNETKIVSNY